MGLAESTIRTYVAAVAKFKHKVRKVEFLNLDDQLLRYVQTFPPMAQRSEVEKLHCAFRHFFPDMAGNLPRLKRFTHQLNRQYRGLTKPPMIWDIVVLVACQFVTMGFPTTAVGILLQFDCFLRPAELAGIRVKHVAFPGGNLLGSKVKHVLILLPKTKTGPLQSVRVESPFVIKLLKKVVKHKQGCQLLFPTYSVYRFRLGRALSCLGLSRIGYTPHSVRHGAATTALINEGDVALPGIMFKGRWESAAGKSYLQMGAAALLFAELPEAIIRQAKEVEKDLPIIFRHQTYEAMF